MRQPEPKTALHSAQANTPEGSDLVQVRALWKGVEEVCVAFFSQLFDTCYVEAHQLLGAMADKASQPEEQHIYRVLDDKLRAERVTSAAAFEALLRRRFFLVFRHLIHPSNTRNLLLDSVPVKNVASLSFGLQELLGRHEVDESIKCDEFLTRLGTLFGEESVDQAVNPIKLEVLCAAFIESSIVGLNLSAREETILLKVFERHFLASVEPVYQRCIQVLAGKDQLTVPKQSVASKRLTHSVLGHANAQQDTFTALASLIRQRVVLSSGSIEADALSHEQLSGLLQSDSAKLLSGAVNDDPLGNKIVPLLNRLLDGSAMGAPRALSANDDLVVNLVSMLFDFMMDDENLALPVRAQLARLQLPVLKAALRDKNVFDSSDHPVRRFINLLGGVGLGYSVLNYKADAFYRKLAYVIDQVNSSTEEVDKTFARAAILLRQILRIEEKRFSRGHFVAEVDEKSADKEEDVLEGAISVVNSELVERLQNALLPQLVIDFIIGSWRKVLLNVCIKKGVTSYVWDDLLQVIDDLVWVCKGHQDMKSLQRVRTLKKEIVMRLSGGLSMTFVRREDYQSDLNAIFDLLSMAENGNMAMHSALRTSRQQLQWKLSGVKPASGTVASEHGSPGGQPSLKYIHLAESLPVGRWVLYKDKESGVVSRCHLISKRVYDGYFVFADRCGSVVLQKSLEDFSLDLEHGRATLLDHRPLFTRALEHIQSRLQA